MSKYTQLRSQISRNEPLERSRFVKVQAEGHWELASSYRASLPRLIVATPETCVINDPNADLKHNTPGCSKRTPITAPYLPHKASCPADWALLFARAKPPLTLWRTPVAIFASANAHRWPLLLPHLTTRWRHSLNIREQRTGGETDSNHWVKWVNK